MRLYQLAGLTEEPAYRVEAGQLVVAEDVWLALVAAGEAFARAGGVVTLDAWGALSVLERAALVEAQDRQWAARATAIGRAAHGRQAAAEVYSRVDGGRTALRVQLAEAALRGAREAAGQEARP